jgi:hypothetical protein
MKPYKQFGKIFQLRWNEPMGLKQSPYLYRWTIIIFGYSIRVHHWIKSDDNRYFHDHSSWLISIVLKGYYWNVKPAKPDSTPYIGNKFMAADLTRHTLQTRNEIYNYVEGMFNSFKNFIHFRNSVWFSKATDRHWLCIPKEGAWTLLIEGRPQIKWGFWVNNSKTGELVKWRPLRYFHKFGVMQTEDYQ